MPPSCPTFESLTAQAVAVAEVPKPRGLFWDLFGGRPDALVQDVINHGDRYSAELTRLATELAEGRKKTSELSPAEQELLNAATLDFYQYKPAVVPTPKTPVSPPRSLANEPIEPVSRPVAGVDLPLGVDPNPYWWM